MTHGPGQRFHQFLRRGKISWRSSTDELLQFLQTYQLEVLKAEGATYSTLGSSILLFQLFRRFEILVISTSPRAFYPPRWGSQWPSPWQRRTI